MELIDGLWVVISAALVFFMQPGFSMVESGLTREKNSINVAIKNLTDIGISVLVYWVIGFAIMFGKSESGIIGSLPFLQGKTGSLSFTFGTFLLFQAMFCSTSATIVSGAVAERMKYSSYIITTLIVSAVIYPVFGHWAWGGLQPAVVSNGVGWLNKLGFVDFAGSTVVHSVGGYVGLAGIIILGARKGRFNSDGTSREIQGSNIPFTEVGQIATLYNSVMEKLEESTMEKESFDAIFNSVNYAMFLVQPDYTISPQYSKVTTKLLCCANPTGYSFPLLMARILSPDKSKALDEFMHALFNLNYKRSTLQYMNPLQKIDVSIRRTIGSANSPSIIEKKSIEFQFTRICNKQQTKVLYIVVCAKGV